MDPTNNPVSDLVNTVFIIGLFSSFGVLMSLAYLGERVEAAKWLVYLLLVGIMGLFALIGAPLAALGFAGIADPNSSIVLDMTAGLEASGIGAASSMYGWLLAVGATLVASAVTGVLCLIPPVRRMIARLIPIDPDRLVHTVALHYVLYLVVVSVSTLVVVQMVAQSDELTKMAGAGVTLSSLWAQAIGFVVIGLLGVGLGARRSWAEARERLGLAGRVDVRWWLGVVVAGLVFGYATDKLWAITSPETLETVEKLTEAMFGPLLKTGLAGALTIGVSAGIGEEILFRGAAQPRLGLPLTALLFAAIHTQYSLSPALIQVLVLGVALGLARQRANTTTAIAAHATYNFILAALAIYAPDWAP